MAVVRLFAAARIAAGTGSDRLPGTTIDEVLAAAIDRYDSGFAEVLPGCQVWLNGEPAGGGQRVADEDEVAILPPVSGGG
ncbi:MAG: MoaD/ThiS family protein [Actinomycetota bacterium]|nr:MoaD/ThiS family protein [Actinomycetota bacterium]